MNKEHSTTFAFLDEEEAQSLSALIETLMSPPVLTLQYSTDYMTLNTDAFNFQFACVFSQQEEYGSTILIGNWSR